MSRDVNTEGWKLRMVGATPNSKSPCETCINFKRIKGYRQGQEIRICQVYVYAPHPTLPAAIPFEVAECDLYNPKSFVDLQELKRIGWIVDIETHKVKGFQDNGKEVTEVRITKPEPE